MESYTHPKHATLTLTLNKRATQMTHQELILTINVI